MKTSFSNIKGKSGGSQNKGEFLAPELQLLLFAVIIALIFFLLFHYIYTIKYTATYLYFNFASMVLHGSLPYRDFSLEYPPFALFFFILPRLFTSVYQTYAIYYHIEVFIFIIIGLLILYYIAQRSGKAPWKMLTFYTVAILAMGPIIGEQYDIFPAIMTLLAIYCFWLGKHKTSWALIALGALTKVYPVFIAPIFLIFYLRNRQYRRIWSGIITFAAISLAFILPFIVIGPDSILYLINYHSQRGIQLESIYSSFLLIADKIGLTSVQTVFNFGSWNLSSPMADTLAKLSFFIMGLFLLIAYWFIYVQVRPGKSQFPRLGAYSLLVAAVTLAFSKVLSPQYLIWLIPLIPLVFGPFSDIVLIVFIAIGALTYFIFPLNYIPLIYLNPDLVAVLFIRDILIVLLAVLAGFSLRRMKPVD